MSARGRRTPWERSLLWPVGGDPATELRAFFEPFLHILFRAGGYAWSRMVIADASRHPANARLFYSCTIDRLTGLVEGYLGELAREGLIPNADLRVRAEAFISVVLRYSGPRKLDHE